MMKIKHALFAAIAAWGFTSCSLINDDSECVESVNVFEFHYTKNLKDADAFHKEVKSVTLLGFNEAGTLVYAQRARQSEMGPDGNKMTVKLPAGEYDFLVWGGDYDEHFTIGSAKIGESKLTDFTCVLNTLEDSHPDSPNAPATHGHSSEHLEHLFHYFGHFTLDYSAPSAPNYHKIDLTKDTNSIRVMLQQQNADSDLSADDFIFEITDRNGHLNHDNSLHPEADQGHVMYHPWETNNASTEYIDLQGSRSDAKVNVVLAELTTNRLTVDHPSTLTVRRASNGETLFQFPLTKYALMVRGKHWSDMYSEQEYLDRQDDYQMTFILDNNQQWTAVVILVNNWRYVFTKTDLQ